MFKGVEHWVKSYVESSMRKSPRNSKKSTFTSNSSGG